jgi:hypothetical protein
LLAITAFLAVVAVVFWSGPLVKGIRLVLLILFPVHPGAVQPTPPSSRRRKAPTPSIELAFSPAELRGGITRNMNSLNNGTANSMSPCEEL